MDFFYFSALYSCQTCMLQWKEENIKIVTSFVPGCPKQDCDGVVKMGFIKVPHAIIVLGNNSG